MVAMVTIKMQISTLAYCEYVCNCWAYPHETKTVRQSIIFTVWSKWKQYLKLFLAS